MKFDDLDAQLRAYETAQETFIHRDAIAVARLDGRGFTRLTKELMPLAKPYDLQFRDSMIATAKHAMSCGFECLYGYLQSDEVSLLFDPNENAFGRSLRKWTSILAGEASSCFSLLASRQAVFDCRIIELPSPEIAVDYFRWRHEDAHRNCLTGWCYWSLRERGLNPADAAARLDRMSSEQKMSLLNDFGITYDTLPAWQRRGIGLWWEPVEKPAVNPTTGQAVIANRRRIATIEELPVGEEYSEFLSEMFKKSRSR